MRKKFFYWEPGFLPSVLAISLPIALQNVISLGVNLMDTIMLGQLNDLAITAASLGGQPFNILNILGFGFASGASVLVSQYWGKRQTEPIRELFAITLRCALAGGASVHRGLWLVSGNDHGAVLPRSPGDPGVGGLSAGAQQVLSASFILFSFSNCYIMCLRGVEQVNISMVMYGTMWLVSVPMGLLAGFVWKLDPPFVFLLMRCDYLAQLLLGGLRLRSGRWIRVMTR